MKALLGLVLLALPLAAAADTVKPVESVETFVNIRLNPEAGTEIVGRLSSFLSKLWTAGTKSNCRAAATDLFTLIGRRLWLTK